MSKEKTPLMISIERKKKRLQEIIAKGRKIGTGSGGAVISREEIDLSMQANFLRREIEADEQLLPVEREKLIQAHQEGAAEESEIHLVECKVFIKRSKDWFNQKYGTDE